MKFAHYDYKCIYYEPSNDPSKKHDTKFFISSNRAEINLGLEYHSSLISIYTDDNEFEHFKLGVDFSPPGSVLEGRCEERMYLNFIIKGKGRVNGVPFSEGQFYYTLPMQMHTVETDSNDPFVSAWISVKGTYINYILDELNKKSEKNIMPLESRSDIMKLTKMFLYQTNLGEKTTLYLKSVIDIYLSYIHNPNSDSDYPEPYYTDKIAKVIRESKKYVKNNLKTVTVADMAADQHYDTKYFSQIFIKAMGLRPLDYIIDCKMKWARNSLVNSDLSITEIMEAIGYDHRNGFTIAFKKKYGCPPAEYRRKTKNNITKPTRGSASAQDTDKPASQTFN